jgi:heme-degrading monooxygenase HmoA
VVITIFRNRVRPESREEYERWAGRIAALARAAPGYLSHKTFTAEDGERVTIVEFESADAQLAWARQPEHAQAQRLGRESFYSEYRLQVCDLLRERAWREPSRRSAPAPD